MQIKDKVVIVTGGANGIDAALIRRFVLEGAKVVIGDIDKESGHELVTELNKSNKINVIFVFCDATNFNHLCKLFDTAQNKFGGIDIVCNNAGIGQADEFYDQTDGWVKILDTNLKAVIKGTQLGIQYLKKCGGGVIINTASLAGFYQLESLPVYTSTKCGIIGFTQSLRDLNNTDKNTSLVKELRKTSSELVQLIDKFGYIPMDEVINAFMMAIQDDNLVGDIIMLPKKNTSQIISNSYLESL
ncbi:10692_t:CDS:2, partial [Gigaspora margarita]